MKIAEESIEIRGEIEFVIGILLSGTRPRRRFTRLKRIEGPYFDVSPLFSACSVFEIGQQDA